MRLAFDATLDEVTDVNLRLAQNTKTFRRQRLWSQVFVGGCLAAVALFAVWRRGALASETIWPVLGIAGAAAVVFAYLYGFFHNWYVRRHTRRMLRELMGDAESVRCEMELRPDSFWCKTGATEFAFPWSGLKRITDTDPDVELWFEGGMAVIRSRAFARAEDRREFLDAARKSVPPGLKTRPPSHP